MTLLRLALGLLLLSCSVSAQEARTYLSGSVTLDASGTATVALPQDFIAVADTQQPYQVLTAGAVVREKTASSFLLVQKALAGQSMDWLIAAVKRIDLSPEDAVISALQQLTPASTKARVSTLIGLDLRTASREQIREAVQVLEPWRCVLVKAAVPVVACAVVQP